MKQVFIGGMTDAPTAASTEYAPIFAGTSSNTWTTGEYWRTYRVAVGGTLSTFQVSIDTAPGAGASITFTIRKNAVDTAVSVTISDTDTTGEYTGAGVVFTAGDRIVVKSTQTNSPALPTYQRWSLLYEGDTPKMSSIMGGTGNGVGTSGTTYQPASGGYTTSTITWRRSLVAINGTIKSFYFSMIGYADAGVTYDISINKNGSVEASSTLTFGSSGSLDQSVTGLNIDIAPGDLLAIQFVITGTVTNNRAPNGWAIGVEADVEGESNVCGMGYNNSGTTTQYWLPTNQSGIAGSTTENQRQNIGGSSILVEYSDLIVYIATAISAGQSRTTKLFKNGSAANQSVTLADANGTGSDSVNTDLFSGFDTMSFETSASGSPAAGVTMWAMKQIEKVYDLDIDVSDSIYINEGPLDGTETVLIDGNSSYGYYFSMYGGNTYAYLGESFYLPTTTYKLTSAGFHIYGSGSPTGNCYSALYEMEGEFGVSGKPSGSPLAISDPYDVSTIPATYSARYFTFSGENQVTLNAGKYYVIVLYYTGGDASNYLRVTYHNTDPHIGNRSYSSNGTTFFGASTNDLAFYVYGIQTFPSVLPDPEISIVDNINISENINSVGGDLGDIIVYDNIISSENYTVQVLTDIYEYYVVIVETLNVTDYSDIFFLNYNISTSDNITITESIASKTLDLSINVSDVVSISEKFTTAYTVIAYDGKTGSTWGYMETTQGRSIARDSNGVVYAVFNAYGSTYSNYEIWIARSTDGGKTWPGGADQKNVYRISSGSCFNPKIAIDSADNIYVSWSGKGATNNPTVTNAFFKKGTFANIGTQSRIILTDSSEVQSAPAMAIDGYDNVHFISHGLGYGANPTYYQIFYRKYLSTGVFENDITYLTDDAFSQFTPSLSIDRFNNIHAVWQGHWSGESLTKIHYIKYTESTQSWGSIDSSLVDVGTSAYYATIAVDSNSDPHVTYWSSNATRYSKLVSGSWATPTSIVDTSVMSGTICRQSISIDKQDNIYIASEKPYGSTPVFDVVLSRFRNGSWQESKNYAYPTNYQTKPNLMFAVHPMTHKQPGVPLLGTLGVWVDSNSTSDTSSSGNIMFHSDIDLAFQDDIYINVHDDRIIRETISTLPLLYTVSVSDSIEMTEGKIIDSTTNSPSSTSDYSILTNFYPEIYQTSGINQMRSDSRIEAGQTFHNENSIKLTSAKMSLWKIGAPTGTAVIKIYAMTGTLGSSGRPTGTVLATSDAVDITPVTGSTQLFEFIFSGANQIILEENTNYCIALSAEGITGDASNYLLVELDSSTLLDPGNYFYYVSSYTYGSIYDFIYYIYGEPSRPQAGVDWINPDNAKIEDGNFATATVSETQVIGWPSSRYEADFTIRNALYTAIASSWENKYNSYVDTVNIYMKSTGSPTSNITAQLYTVYGNVGAFNSYPETLLATADPIDSTTVSSSYSYVTFTFSGAEKILLEAGSNYFLVITFEGGGVSDNIQIGCGNSGLFPGGTAIKLGTWQAAGWEVIFDLYGSGYTYKLAAKNFGFSIPTNAKIYGVTAEVKAKATGVVKDYEVQLIKPDNELSSSNLATLTTLPSSETYATYGGVNELWGGELTYSEINDTNFGVAYSAFGLGDVSVDHIRLIIQYTVREIDVTVDSSIDTFDTISTTENVSMDNPYLVSVSDTVSIQEDITSNGLLGGIDVFDSLSIVDEFVFGITINVTDSINIIEDNSFFFLNWVINTSELINISENINSSNESSLSAVDNLSILDVVTVKILLLGDINIYDLLNITEGPAATGTIDSATTTGGTVDTIASQGGNVAGWSDIDNVKISNDTYATAGNAYVEPTVDETNTLKVTNFDFSSIPNTATITGIKVTVEKKSSHDDVSDYCRDDSVFLNKADDTASSSSRADSITHWPTTETNIDYGGSKDTWGLNLNIEDIKNSNFGVRFKAIVVSETTAVTAYVDSISITVYYSLTSGPKVEEISTVNIFDLISIEENNNASVPVNISTYELINITENYTDIIPTYYISVSDQVNITENHTEITPTYYISVSDQVNTTENYTGIIPTYYISVSDQVSITENIVSISSLSGVVVSDQISISESASISNTDLGNINVSDNLNIIDVPSISNKTLSPISTYDNLSITDTVILSGITIGDIYIYDSINIYDIIESQKEFTIDIVDSINISENIDLIITVYFLDIYDNLTISESYNFDSYLGNINIFDLINISEETIGETPYGINLYDNINVLEPAKTFDDPNTTFDDILLKYDGYFIDIELISFINEIDYININESIITEPSISNINIFDYISISENLEGIKNLTISTFDNINIVEYIDRQIEISRIYVSEIVNIYENLSEVRNLVVFISDNININELNINEVNIPNIFIYDSINISENLDNIRNLTIFTFDNINITEEIQTQIGNLSTNINDIIKISQNIDINTSIGLIDIYDSVLITEGETIELSDLSILIYDNINITDNYSANANININTDDNITISEYINTESISVINIMENVIITDIVVIESFRFSPSIKKPKGSGHSIGNPNGSINSIRRPSGSMSSIRTPVGTRNNIGNPIGSMKTVGRPSGSVN